MSTRLGEQIFTENLIKLMASDPQDGIRGRHTHAHFFGDNFSIGFIKNLMNPTGIEAAIRKQRGKILRQSQTFRRFRWVVARHLRTTTLVISDDYLQKQHWDTFDNSTAVAKSLQHLATLNNCYLDYLNIETLQKNPTDAKAHA